MAQPHQSTRSALWPAFVSAAKPWMLLAVASGVTMGLTGCQLLAKPEADVHFSQLHFKVTNTGGSPWEKCAFIINEDAGEDDAFFYDVASLGAGETIRIVAPQFTKKDGRRFIPVLNKANTLTISCNSHGQPYKTPLDDSLGDAVDEMEDAASDAMNSL